MYSHWPFKTLRTHSNVVSGRRNTVLDLVSRAGGAAAAAAAARLAREVLVLVPMLVLERALLPPLMLLLVLALLALLLAFARCWSCCSRSRIAGLAAHVRALLVLLLAFARCWSCCSCSRVCWSCCSRSRIASPVTAAAPAACVRTFALLVLLPSFLVLARLLAPSCCC